ncbi:MAG: hypothetical protein PHN92_04490 [Geobacter sp.]|nr:hypothetical protein [Geobacter sp.]
MSEVEQLTYATGGAGGWPADFFTAGADAVPNGSGAGRSVQEQPIGEKGRDYPGLFLYGVVFDLF